ncbi:MAG: SDR family oxidoreductase [Planctomycetes bacterium]|nr:SDR family oxidoreductase [Planctomycetota bacterium]
MAITLKPLADQVIVITGATSGIGLATARLAAARGAKVVLNARAEDGLREVADGIRAAGGDVAWFAGDVASSQDMDGLAEAAIRAYGRIDTWVNNAGISVYGRLEETPLAEKRRLFDVTFWGVVNGAASALPHLRRQGGALINIGSVVGERAIPLQGAYVAAKHAVKGYTDTLRMELEEQGAPVVVTLIKPTSIDTPFTDHARNHLDVQPKLPAPVYAPEVVARTILFCATHPRRDVLVGGGGKAFSLMEKFAPRLTDRLMKRTLFSQQRSDRPARGDDDLFDAPTGASQERGSQTGHVMRSSVYTEAALRPWLTGAAVATAAVGMAWLLARRRGRRPSPRAQWESRVDAVELDQVL